MKNDKMKTQYRVNEQIRAREVRVVGEDGAQVMPTRQALEMARQMEVDLVEISPNAQPPVCRLIDYSKFLYQQKKHQKEMKQKQVKVEVKEIRFVLTCSSVVEASSSRSKEKFSCCVSPMTLRNLVRWSSCQSLRARRCSYISHPRRLA